MSEPLDDEMLHAYAEKFFGYGSLGAPFWLVGIEEGGGDTLEGVQVRLKTWDERGMREVEELAAFHRAMGVGEWFDGKRPRIQPTWGRLIRILLAAAGLNPSREDVRSYQAEQLGRVDGETALLELFPLPSPSVKHWTYSEWSSLPQLDSRERYHRHYSMQRADCLRRRREEKRPVAVVYYGLSPAYQHCWEHISGTPLREAQVAKQRVRVGTDGRTVFVAMPHPTARGLSNEFFHRLGRLISEIRDGHS